MESDSDLTTLGTVEVVSRFLSRPVFNGTVPDGLGGSDSAGGGGEASNNHSGREAYEFVAFLLWYLFLVLCCVLPTCCAYRRRRLMEARLAQQQANFDQIHQQNVFILSNLHLRQAGGAMGGAGLRLDLDSDEARAERTKRITAALKPTTFTVDEKDISMKEVNGNKANGNGDGGDGSKNDVTGSTQVVLDEEMGGVVVPIPPHEEIDNSLLQLPSEAPNGSRVVPGGCAICLCPYEEGDLVSWSKEVACQHAFHQECIIPWLAKKDEPKCPCCRQEFCVVEPLTPADLAALAAESLAAGAHHHHLHHHHLHHHGAMSPFGLIPTSFMAFEPPPTTPSPDLTVSQIVTEEGVVSIAPLMGQTQMSSLASTNLTNATMNIPRFASPPPPPLPLPNANMRLNEDDQAVMNNESRETVDQDDGNDDSRDASSTTTSESNDVVVVSSHDDSTMDDESAADIGLAVTASTITQTTTATGSEETAELSTPSSQGLPEESSEDGAV